MENYFVLNNGVQMPCIGLGVFRMKPGECEKSVLCAIEKGYRMIDTAAAYRNEEAAGRAIAQCGVPREQLFITTKLWYSDCSHDMAKRALDRSLKKLGLDYVDLYLIHEPYGWLKGAWRALEESVAEGKVRAIGVSNFTEDDLKKLLAYADIVPAVNQIEIHPLYQRDKLRQFMAEKDILAEAWAPFAAAKEGIFSHPTIVKIANKHGCSAGQAILAFLHAQGIAVIPKSVKAERMAENLDFVETTLDAEDMDALRALDRGESLFPWDKGVRRPLRKALGYLHIAW